MALVEYHHRGFVLGTVGVAITIQAATSFSLTLLLSVEAQHLIANLRAQVQEHVLQLPVRVFDNTKSGELVSRIMDDVEGVRNLIGTGLVQLVGGTVTAIVAFFFLATGCTPIDHDRQGPEEEAMELLHLPLDDALDLIDRGDINDAKTVAGLLATDRRLRT